MKTTKEKSILIIAPSLIAESISLKLTSLDNDLNISLDRNDPKVNPDLIIWNILNYESEDLIRLELIKIKEKWSESKILIIFSSEFIKEEDTPLPNLNCEGIILNPQVEKVLESINIILEGGRVFDLNAKYLAKIKTKKEFTFNQKILTSGLKQIDSEINNIFSYLNYDKTPKIYKFILKGRLRELITAKSLLIFLWGNTIEMNSNNVFSDSTKSDLKNKDNTIFIKNKNSLDIWEIIYSRLLKKYSSIKIEIDLKNPDLILTGLKKEYINKLLTNILSELNKLITNLKDNSFENFEEEEFISLISELKKNTLINIEDSYFRVKKDNDLISLSKFLSDNIQTIEDDSESHRVELFFKPIINNEPLSFEGRILPLYETESFKLIEEIISNWAIRICNNLASEIFNLCSEYPELRANLINNKLLSTRNFERFRNNINNYNRWHNNIRMPINFYESKREYIDIMDNKLIRYYRNENREKDLRKLEWFQRQVTLIIEIRDAVAPQLEIIVRYIGDFVVTILTKIVGKSIGLIGKGILQGLGRANSK